MISTFRTKFKFFYLFAHVVINVLFLYNMDKKSKVAADASSYITLCYLNSGCTCARVPIVDPYPGRI